VLGKQFQAPSILQLKCVYAFPLLKLLILTDRVELLEITVS
jgi:hypothetical protein